MTQRLPAGAQPSGFLNRWSTYFGERFPPLQHGGLIAALCFGILGVAARAGEPFQRPVLAAFGVAFATVFLQMLQLRILDEFKDDADDARWRPYRPVPRGLVSLRSLGYLWFGAAVLQVLIVWLLDARLIAAIAVVWAYSGLMRVEFFAPGWLRAHPFAYMASHIVIAPLIALQIAFVHWLPSGVAPGRIGAALAATYLAFCVVEVGRKLRAPGEEEPGVATYTALWGRPRAVGVWLSFMFAGSAAAWLSAAQMGASPAVAVPVGVALAISMAAALRFTLNPGRPAARRFNLLSGLWVVTMFLGLGFASLA